jgi:hypothetical protein
MVMMPHPLIVHLASEIALKKARHSREGPSIIEVNKNMKNGGIAPYEGVSYDLKCQIHIK